MDMTGLSLYPEIQFSGRETYFNGNSLRLPLSRPYPTIVQSYGFTGPENWTIFSNIDFTGSATCLRRLSGFTYDIVYSRLGATYTVGSQRKGCSSYYFGAQASNLVIRGIYLIFTGSILSKKSFFFSITSIHPAISS